MKEIIKQILFMAYDEKNLDLANVASDLMFELSITYDCPSEWRDITEELYNEYKDNEWIVNAVFEFQCMEEDNNE